MLKRLLFVGALVGGLICPAAQATTALTLAPAGGAIAGKPNAPIGWGFNLLNDENFLVVTSASFETTAPWGSFTDFISGANFFVVGPGPSGSTVWAQKFDAATQTGIGSFVIDKGTPKGSVATGNIVLSYDLFSRSPLDERFNPNTDTVSNGNLLSSAASVTVAVPEPATWASLLAGLGVLGWRVRRKSTNMKHFVSSLAALSFTLLWSSDNLAADFRNGSFENYPKHHSGAPTVYGDAIDSWRIDGNVDWVAGNYHPAADGYYSLDLNGAGSLGSIFQTFDTVVGRTYRVSFAMSGEAPYGGSGSQVARVKTIHVSAGAYSGDFSFDTKGVLVPIGQPLRWENHSFEFTATSTTTTIRFTSTSPDPCNCVGPWLDNVSLEIASCEGVLPELSALISGKTGTQDARNWAVSVSNKSYCPGQNLQIDGLKLTQTYGIACTPVISSPATFPLALGDIAANGKASGPVTINFSACSSTARFTARITYSANDGAVKGTKTLNNQFR